MCSIESIFTRSVFWTYIAVVSVQFSVRTLEANLAGNRFKGVHYRNIRWASMHRHDFGGTYLRLEMPVREMQIAASQTALSIAIVSRRTRRVGGTVAYGITQDTPSHRWNCLPGNSKGFVKVSRSHSSQRSKGKGSLGMNTVDRFRPLSIFIFHETIRKS